METLQKRKVTTSPINGTGYVRDVWAFVEPKIGEPLVLTGLAQSAPTLYDAWCEQNRQEGKPSLVMGGTVNEKGILDLKFGPTGLFTSMYRRIDGMEVWESIHGSPNRDCT
ncbi:MAG TPA: hypothetical protein VJH69_02560 [Candidatus Paceibacterota bacterium]